MKISVVIPAYQAAVTIKDAISSVLTQTFTDFEVLVVNDGSSDETTNIIEAVSDKRVCLLVHPTNKGAAAARNTGIRAAQGELIAFLDADDVWVNEKLAKQVSLMENHPEYGGCITGYRYETEEGTSIETPQKPESWLREFSKGCAVAPGTTLIVRRTCYDMVGYYDETMPRHEDFEWLLRYSRVYDLGVVREPLAVVRRAGQSSAWKIEAANQAIIQRYRDVFLGQGKFFGHQVIGKRWLETSIHCFMDGDRKKGWTYLRKAVLENPFQRPGMYSRVLDLILGTSIYLSFKRLWLNIRWARSK